VFLLAHPKGTQKKGKGKGKGKEEFPEHWIFPLLLAPPAKEREKGKCNQASLVIILDGVVLVRLDIAAL